MGIATHLGPWVLGTVRSTTGTTPGLIRNTGSTVVSQSGSLTVNTTSAITLCVIPAGSQIINIVADITTAFAGTTGNTITVQTGSATTGLSTNYASGQSLVTFGSATTTPLSLGRISTTFTSAQSAVSIMQNVGTTDLILQVLYACAGTASGGGATVTVNYTVRQPDGTYVPTSFTGP